jgi:peptidoglycan/LPS O-acetylase OafA/YrhL
VVLWSLGRGKAMVALLLLFVALGPFARTVWAHDSEVWQEYSYLGGMDAIALGCLTALVLARVELTTLTVRLVGCFGAALLVLCLGFTHQTAAWGLESSGLDMSLVGVATCLIIAAAAKSGWRSSRILHPLIALGRCSYEIYLTHMFVVFAAFRFFVSAGKPMGAVPALFAAVILVAGALGALVARLYSEPVNRWLRRRWGDGADSLGSAIVVAPKLPD